MMTLTAPAARVYVGTYAKYNAGSIKGAWLDLSDYSDADEFYAGCRELHKDEADPELMFQDFEGFPRGFYGESHIDAALWDWLELDEDDRELLEVFQHGVDQSGTIEQARDAYMGKADTEADFAEQWLDETDGLAAIPEHLRNYFDFAAYARDMRLGGDVYFVRHEGDVWAFSSNY